jgi:hypothetical protein
LPHPCRFQTEMIPLGEPEGCLVCHLRLDPKVAPRRNAPEDADVVNAEAEGEDWRGPNNLT